MRDVSCVMCIAPVPIEPSTWVWGRPEFKWSAVGVGWFGWACIVGNLFYTCCCKKRPPPGGDWDVPLSAEEDDTSDNRTVDQIIADAAAREKGKHSQHHPTGGGGDRRRSDPVDWSAPHPVVGTPTAAVSIVR